MICIICRGEIDVQSNGWDGGHNAEPILTGRCCTECNTHHVIPARIRRFQSWERRKLAERQEGGL